MSMWEVSTIFSDVQHYEDVEECEDEFINGVVYDVQYYEDVEECEDEFINGVVSDVQYYEDVEECEAEFINGVVSDLQYYEDVEESEAEFINGVVSDVQYYEDVEECEAECINGVVSDLQYYEDVEECEAEFINGVVSDLQYYEDVEECEDEFINGVVSDLQYYEDDEEREDEFINGVPGLLCLLEKLHFEEPTEKNQDACLLEDLHSEEPIEIVEKRKESFIKCVVAKERWINHYSSFQKILLVGEGDFSFSASLAMAFCSASNMTATSLDSREFLRNNYRNAITNIENLISMGCRVMHGIDATKIANNPLFKGMKFDRVIFNFPFAGFFKTESRYFQLSKHRRLVSLFLGNAKEMINETGEIHITHKTNAFHCEWNLELLAALQGLRLIEAVHFNYTDYPGYRTKYGFGGDSDFNCNPSKTYKFGLRTAGHCTYGWE